MRHRARRAAGVALVVLSSALPAAHGASDFEDGVAAYDRGDPAAAHAIWAPLARAGDSRAQNNLGWLYEHGEGVDGDLEQALQWYARAAAGDAKWAGNRDRVREQLAASRPAVTFADGVAAYDAGDARRAAEIWTPFAHAGNADAQNNLGWLYEHGEGVERDLARALEWYTRAAAGEPRWTSNRDRVRGLLSSPAAAPPAPPASAEVRVDAPPADAFENGVAAYDAGDARRAAAIWDPLARGGHSDAQNNLGWLYEHGEGVERNLGRAIYWYQRAAASNPRWTENLERVRAAVAGRVAPAAPVGERFAEAMRLFDAGEDRRAAALLRRLADEGHSPARTNLGYLYEAGRGVPRNEREARDLYLAAARAGEPNAQNNLAVLLAAGRGGQVDLVGAYLWFALAAHQGHADAADHRDQIEPMLSAEQRGEAEQLLRAQAVDG